MCIPRKHCILKYCILCEYCLSEVCLFGECCPTEVCIFVECSRNTPTSIDNLPIKETPPHAWGILCSSLPEYPNYRNTPTRVGNTGAKTVGLQVLWKHPHTRGEYSVACAGREGLVETPPHAWGILFCPDASEEEAGNTPTRVGNTAAECGHVLQNQKHPHTRGEYSAKTRAPVLLQETPPHAWGIQFAAS